MSAAPDPDPAIASLDDALAALAKLDKTCCVPGRSPRMQELRETITQARTHISDLPASDEAGDRAAERLEDAGAQVGRLQVGCCAPDRLPLYARMLEDLTTARLALDTSRGLAH